MRTAVDTNVISALWSHEPTGPQMAALLGRLLGEGGLVICAPVYAELLAHPKATGGFVDGFLAKTEIAVDFLLDEQVWREAGRVFGAYAQRRRRSRARSPKRLLVDFLVGAHAGLCADRLLTLEVSRYQQYFPELKLLPAGKVQ